MAGTSGQLRSELRRGRPLVLDAAMGTELERRGVSSRLPLWSARALLLAPEAVRAVHEENVRAGADLLTANTFRTQRRTLEKEGMGDRATELTTRAVDLARQACAGARRPLFVLGALSPLEDCYRPDLRPSRTDLESEHREQAEILRAAAVDGLLVETQNSVEELACAVAAARATGLPVLASLITDGEGRLLSGESIGEAVEAIGSPPPDVLAINCVPARRLAGDLRRLADAALGVPLGAYGNLGPPKDPEGLHFEAEIAPEEYAALASEWLDLGARVVGGCCGTTAAHTAALRALVDSRRA